MTIRGRPSMTGDRARESATEQRESGLLAALHEHCVRTNPSELPRDAEREQRIEQWLVDDPRTHAADEAEARIGRPHAGRRGEHVHVEHRLEGVELVRERGRQGEARSGSARP
jgi:hypothetical protein